MDKRVRDQLRAIEGEGFKVKRVTRQGNSHMRAYVDTPRGEEFIILACSPSCDATFIARTKARRLNRGRR